MRGDFSVLNDIFLIINELDEKQSLRTLPTFVSDSVDEMPSKAIFDGDLRVMLSYSKKL